MFIGLNNKFMKNSKYNVKLLTKSCKYSSNDVDKDCLLSLLISYDNFQIH